VLDALISAAVAQARSDGPDAVILREATRTVGVSPNAAYRHFADRDDLLSAVAWAAMGMLAARMQHELDGVTGRPGTQKWARKRLRAVGRAYLAFAAEEPGLFRSAFAAPRGPHAARAHTPRATDLPRTPLDILNSALDDLVSAGSLPPERRENASALAWASVHGLAALRLAGAITDDDHVVLDIELDRFIQRGL